MGHADRAADRLTDRQIGRPIDRQAYGKTDRQSVTADDKPFDWAARVESRRSRRSDRHCRISKNSVLWPELMQ